MFRWISALLVLCASYSSWAAIDIQPDTLYPQVEFDTSLSKIVVELDRTRAPIPSITF